MEDNSNSSEELEDNMLAYIEKSQNLFRLGNELNNKIDNFKQDINSLQYEFKDELNSVKISYQILAKKIFQKRKGQSDQISISSASSNVTRMNSESNFDMICPSSPHSVTKKAILDEENRQMSEESKENVNQIESFAGKFARSNVNQTFTDTNIEMICPSSPSIIRKKSNLTQNEKETPSENIQKINKTLENQSGSLVDSNVIQRNSNSNIEKHSSSSPKSLDDIDLEEGKKSLTEEEALSKLNEMAKEDGFFIDKNNQDTNEQFNNNIDSNLTEVNSRTDLEIENKNNSNEELTEKEALLMLNKMAKEDGFSIDQIEETELDKTLESDVKDKRSSLTKECKVELEFIDLNNLNLLKKHKLSPVTLEYLSEMKDLNEDLSIDKLCRFDFNKTPNSTKKKVFSRRKGLRPRKNIPDSESFSETESDMPEIANLPGGDNKKSNFLNAEKEIIRSDNFEITEDESSASMDLDKTVVKKINRLDDESNSDCGKTSSNRTNESEKDAKLDSTAHEYRDSKQTPGYIKQTLDLPKLNLSNESSSNDDEDGDDDEKENKMPRNEGSDEEIKLKPTRFTKRLTSETSEEKDEEDFEDLKKSTLLKGIIVNESEKENEDQNKENIVELDSDSDKSDVIKPIIKKRKRPKFGSDSENSAKSKIKTRSSAKKDLKEEKKESDESSSMSYDSDIQTIHSSDEESPSKNETRHKLRNIIQDGKLTKETQDAIQAERERKKRIEEKHSLQSSISPVGKNDLFLDVDPVSKKLLVKVDPEISKYLKPHQIEGLKFMWDSCYESCEMIKNGDKGSGCLLAHCMGLGKTFQVISLVHTLLTNRDLTKCKRVLILLPVNVLNNWKKEFRNWTRSCQKQITVYLLPNDKGFSKDLARARFNEIETWYRKGGVLLLSYSMFVRIVNGKNIKPQKLVESFNKYLLSPGPNLVVCDEGHMLKVATSALNKSVSKFSTARRIVLTGTPLQNNLIEYHCMVSFVKPNLLGTIKEFKNRFANPISNGQHKDSTEADVRYMKKRAHILHDVLDGCVQRKDYAVIRDYLKPKKEYVLSIRLSDIQMDLYRTYIQMYSTRTKSSRTKGAELFQDFQILYRVCSHPWVFKLNEVRVLRREVKLAEKNFVADDNEEENEIEMAEDVLEICSDKTQNGSAKKPEVNGGGVNGEESTNKVVERWWSSLISEDMEFDINMSGKLIVLEKILKLCAERGDKLLLFSQSLFTLDLVEIFLEKLTKEKKDKWKKEEDYFRLDGQTDVNKRQHDVDKFNDERNRRGRLFLISTKAGGIGINLVGANRCIIFDACWNPSYDTQSIFRIYRFGQKKNVFVYRFLAQGTMEEKIYQRQVTKQSLSHRVIDEHQIDRHFTSQEINELYNFEPDLWYEKGIVFDIPEDNLLKSLLVDCKRWISKYHEHDSLLENKLNEGLSEEERKAAWEEYENEKRVQTYHANQNELAMHNTFQNLHDIPNDPNFSMRLFNGMLPNETNRMSEPFNAHIQALQREHLMEQLQQQHEVMRQHELRNSLQMDRLMKIHDNKLLNNMQKMEQLMQNSQYNQNIRIPSSQRKEVEMRPNSYSQNLANILGTPRTNLNDNKFRENLRQQSKNSNLTMPSITNVMGKNLKQFSQKNNFDPNQ